MNDAPEPPNDAAESRAIELLRLVGTQSPSTSARFTVALVARARAQRAVAEPLRTLGGLLAAMAIALAGAVQTTRRERRR